MQRFVPERCRHPPARRAPLARGLRREGGWCPRRTAAAHKRDCIRRVRRWTSCLWCRHDSYVPAPECGDATPRDCANGPADRKSVVEGKSVSVRVDIGGRRTIKKKKKII